MKSKEQNTTPNNFLKNEQHLSLTAHHQKYLGTEVPKVYFKMSKQSILDKIKAEEVQHNQSYKKQKVVFMRTSFKYIVAASLVFLIGLTLWLQHTNSTSKEQPILLESYALEHEVLIESLLIPEKDLNEFTEVVLFNQVMVKAELKEQKIEDLVLDIILVEDTLLENYIEKALVDTVIL